MITMAQRDECRDVQDRLVAIAKRQGVTDQHAIVWGAPRITLVDMQTTIYPALLPEFKAILRQYESRTA